VADTDVIDQQTSGHISGTLVTRDGTRLTFRADNFATQIEDRNGNLISFPPFQSTPTGGIYTAVDPTGRQETINFTEGQIANTQDIFTYPGSSGSSRTVTINYAQLHQVLFGGESIQTLGCLFPELDGSTATGFDPG
jgi:hypothetical protein